MPEVVRSKRPRTRDGALYHRVADEASRDKNGRQVTLCGATVRSQWRRVNHEPSHARCPECWSHEVAADA